MGPAWLWLPRDVLSKETIVSDGQQTEERRAIGRRSTCEGAELGLALSLEELERPVGLECESRVCTTFTVQHILHYLPPCLSSYQYLFLEGSVLNIRVLQHSRLISNSTFSKSLLTTPARNQVQWYLHHPRFELSITTWHCLCSTLCCNYCVHVSNSPF